MARVVRGLLLLATLLAFELPSVPARAADAPQTGTPGTAIPFKKEPREASADWGNLFAGFIVVVGIGWAALYALRRSRFLPNALGGAAHKIRLIEALRLDARVTLYLVSSEGRSFLLGRCGDALIVVKDFGASGPHGGADAA